jgi:hypothetical protein
MTKVIDIPDDEPEKPEPEKPVFDTGDGARKEPMSLAQLEAAVIPAFQAQQRKYKPKPIKYEYESPEDYDARVRQEHRIEDSRYYQGRPRATGSETRRRSVNRLGRLVGEHGAHKIQGAYGAFKDAPVDEPTPTFQPAPETTMGYCHFCNRTIGPGMKAGSKFCSDAHRIAFHRQEDHRHEFNKLFKDYWETAAGKAEAVLQADARHVAAIEMKESAERAGIEAEFFATPTGVMVRSDKPLPPIRFKVLSTIDHPKYGAFPAEQPLEVQTSDVPELGATLYTFSFPMHLPGHIGKMVGLEASFLGDPGIYEKRNGYLTLEQEEAESREKVQADAAYLQFERDQDARAARRERAQAERIARGDLTGTTSARDTHQEERMRNLLARPDHDVIIAEFEEAKNWYGLKEFYRARRRQELKNSRVTDSGNKSQLKQRVS